jgi:hypothetical protein
MPLRYSYHEAYVPQILKHKAIYPLLISSIFTQSSVAPMFNLQTHQPIERKMEKLEFQQEGNF